jgi:hypothetical protein
LTDEFDDRERFFNRRTDKMIISKGFTDNLSGATLRIASHVVEGQPGLKFAKVEDEMVLRQTPGGRFEIKATFLEDDRAIKTLTIQKYSNKSGPLDKQSFSFVGSEIESLINFVAGLKTAPLPGSAKVHLTDDAVRQIVLDRGQAQRLLAQNAEIFLELAQHEDISRDLVAVGYRRKQLKRFESMLSDADCFKGEQTRLGCTPEKVWQSFFQSNTWIFGYGLSYQFLSELDGRPLEQMVRGHDLTGSGKRADALMKTRGIISSLCFIEIKRHDTHLLTAAQYRPEVWSPSSELAGGVSQVQRTVHAAIEAIGNSLTPTDSAGNPTAETLFNVEPRSCLVVGSLGEFRTEHGFNAAKFRSFELFRRNTWRPEIVTFDELLERARFIVEHSVDASAAKDKGNKPSDSPE